MQNAERPIKIVLHLPLGPSVSLTFAYWWPGAGNGGQ